MLQLKDPKSGLLLSNLPAFSKKLENKVLDEDLQKALSSMILSASGWRKVFAESGDEEDTKAELKSADVVLSALMFRSFAEYLSQKLSIPTNKLRICLGCDTRPTGTFIADGMIHMAVHLGIQVDYLFIAAAPEIMAHARCESGVHGFAYISASHNPIGHNGVKFGYNTGGVLGGEDSRVLIQNFQALLATKDLASTTSKSLLACDLTSLENIYRRASENKKLSLYNYTKFSHEVLAGSKDEQKQVALYSKLQAALQVRKIGIVADLNGSARTLSIDENFLPDLGLELSIINGKAGEIAHRIVPEGASLDFCARALEAKANTNSNYILGYMPDCDGDRGNLVYYNKHDQKAHTIEAQEVFALVVLAELADLVRQGQLTYDANGCARNKVAIAVNDPTSNRIEELAAVFGVSVHRAEVGEANVVNLAQSLRDSGSLVRILGEGSNGGNITHPAAVRDPLNTIVSLIKLLCLRDEDGTPGLFHLYCQKANLPYKDDFDILDILTSLPKWRTTSAYETKAMFPIRTNDHTALKAAYEDIFLKDWEVRKDELKNRYGIVSWEEHNYEGMVDTLGFGKKYRSGKERGGFKILFKNSQEKSLAYMWMRGSGTEAVFRVMVDVKSSNPLDEEFFLTWHRSLVERADALIS